MAKSLMDKKRTNPFAEGASRMASIARPQEQMGEQGGDLAAATDRMSAVSPDEAWSRRFMSMGIGPDPSKPYAPAAPVSEPTIQMAPQMVPRAEIAPRPELQREFTKPGKPGPIGLAIGKPVRRSLMARLFGRR